MVKYLKHSEEAQKLIFKIDELREEMYDMIQIKSDLTDTEIVTISQEIDLALNRYNELLELNMTV